MDQEEFKIPVHTYITLGVVAGTAVFGTYQLTKLAGEWAFEGYKKLRDKKAQAK